MWVLVGCLGLIVLALVALFTAGVFVKHKLNQSGLNSELMKRNPALAAAKMMVAMNPNIEEVSVDEDRGVITLRQKSTGKLVTMNFEDIKNGKISFEGENGEKVTIGGQNGGLTVLKGKEGTVRVGSTWNPPEWLPTPTGAKVEGSSSSQTPEADSGMGSLTTSASVDDVIRFYEDGLKNQGLEVTRVSEGMLQAKDSEAGKRVNVNVTAEGGVTRIVVSYSIKRR